MYAAASIQVRPVSRLFKALGDETRLRIVALLCHGELCVCHIESALGLSQPNASRQMAILRTAGIVESRRRGTWVYYQLANQVNEECKQHLQSVVRAFGNQKVLGQDVARLLKSKGPTSCK